MSKLLYQSEYALLTYYRDEKTLKLVWKKSCPDCDYINTFEEAVKIAVDNKVSSFISDIRKQGPVSYKSLVWLKTNIIKKAIQMEIKKVGLIFDGDLFSKLYADSIRLGLDNSRIAINYFKNDDEAIHWIQS